MTTLTNKSKLLFACGLIVLVNIFVYYSALDIRSFRADIFILLRPLAENPNDYFSIFKNDTPQKVRPLGPLLYYLSYNWYGLDPYPCLLSAFIFHIAVCVGSFFLVNFFCRNFGIALLSSLLYSVFYLGSPTATVDFTATYALALAISLLGVLLFLSKPESIRRSIFVSGLFLVAMAFKESTIVFPVITVLLARSLYQHLKLKHFIPILTSSFVYGCYVLFLLFFVFPTEAQSQNYLHKGSFFGTLWWNLVYGLVPFNFGNVNYLTAALSHLYLIGLAILYLLLDNPNAKEKIKVLFLCALLCYLPFAIGGQGLSGGYNFNSFIFIAPMLIILFNEYLLRLKFLWRPPIFNPTVCLVLILIISNYVSTQKIIAAYKLTTEITRRDLKDDKLKDIFPNEVPDFTTLGQVFYQSIHEGKIERPMARINIVPHFLSPLVWGDNSELYHQAWYVWKLTKRRKGNETSDTKK